MVTKYDIGDVVYFTTCGQNPHKGIITGVHIEVVSHGIVRWYDIEDCVLGKADVDESCVYRDKAAMVKAIKANQQHNIDELLKKNQEELNKALEALED